MDYLAFGIAMAALTACTQECRVIVYVNAAVPVEATILSRAEMKTTAMFREIGVELRWRAGSIPLARSGAYSTAIGVRLESGAEGRASQDALAYTTPFAKSVTPIHVLIDRTVENRTPEFAIALLAHVMAHEIGHVLERIDRHSTEGVMKARWTIKDFRRMESHSLPFAAEDVAFIHLGIAGAAAGFACQIDTTSLLPQRP